MVSTTTIIAASITPKSRIGKLFHTRWFWCGLAHDIIIYERNYEVNIYYMEEFPSSIKRDGEKMEYDSGRDRDKMLRLASAKLAETQWEEELQPLIERAKVQLDRLAANPQARDEELAAEAGRIRDESDRVARLNTRDTDVARRMYRTKSQAQALASIAVGEGIEYDLLGYHSAMDYERIFGQA
jgi:hypothetical protein